MDRIKDSDELCNEFAKSIPVTLTLRSQFVSILRDGNRAVVWKNIRGRLTVECFPNEAAWPDGVPVVKGLTVLLEEKGKDDSLVLSYKVLLRLQLAGEPDELWCVGSDKTDRKVQLFLAYDDPKMMRVETVVIVEGDIKKPKSCGSISFGKNSKKTLNNYVKIVKALMGFPEISLTPLLDGDTSLQLPEAFDDVADDKGTGAKRE